MTSVYSDYFSDEKVTVRKKDYYTTKHGFPNRKAFLDFMDGLSDKDTYHLVCVNVDLRKANKESHDYGDYFLRRFIYLVVSNGILVFHISGEKFNFLCPEKSIKKMTAILDEPSDEYDVYYGLIEDVFTKEKSQEQIQQGIEKMFSHKAKKKFERVRNGVVVQNTPYELQETNKRKFRKTMWYTVIELTTIKPKFQMVKVYVFPTEYLKPLASLSTIVVVDDAVEYRLYSGKNVTFGVGGVQFSVSCRFGRDGLLNVAFFKASEGEFEHKIYTHKGVCIPANFGKRVSDGKELFPIRENINGLYDYVLWDSKDEKAELCRTGIYKDGDTLYGVYQDKDFIDLIAQ